MYVIATYIATIPNISVQVAFSITKILMILHLGNFLINITKESLHFTLHKGLLQTKIKFFDAPSIIKHLKYLIMFIITW